MTELTAGIPLLNRCIVWLLTSIWSLQQLLATGTRPVEQPQHSDLRADVDRDPQKVSLASPQEDLPHAIEIIADHALRLERKFAAGAYADIHKATMIIPGGTERCQVAVKVLRYNGTVRSPEEYEQTLMRIYKRLSREIEVWKRLTHIRITPLLAYAKGSSEVLPGGEALLISPYRENANLRTYLLKKPNADKLLLLQQVCEGLNYMHTSNPPIAHLDLKPENILINDSEEAELCDFGLAKALEDACTGFTTSTFGMAGTLIYMSPEALNADPQTTDSDIYAMGGVILHVMSGDPPWRQIGAVQVIQQVLNGKTPLREDYTISGYDPPVVEEIWVLLQRCWSFDPLNRPKALAVLNTLANLRKPDSAADDNPVDLENGPDLLHRSGIATDSPDDPAPSPQPRNVGPEEHEDLLTEINHGQKTVSRRRLGRPQRDAPLRNPTVQKEDASNHSMLYKLTSVLIVEDNPINQTILTVFMKRRNIKYETAKNGQEAVDKWRSGNYHLILMDIAMPVKDGIEATKEIRNLEKERKAAIYPRTSPQDIVESAKTTDAAHAPYRSPVIIVGLTASGLKSDRVAILAAGCNDFLTKPISMSWLNNKIIEWGSIKALEMFQDPATAQLLSGQNAKTKPNAPQLGLPPSRQQTPSSASAEPSPERPSVTILSSKEVASPREGRLDEALRE